MEWQPIETAPKDGTAILLWPCWSDEIVYAGKWYDGKVKNAWVTQWGNQALPGKITHWMPLPEPPQAKEE